MLLLPVDRESQINDMLLVQEYYFWSLGNGKERKTERRERKKSTLNIEKPRNDRNNKQAQSKASKPENEASELNLQ